MPVSASPALHDDIARTHVGLTVIVFVSPTIVALVLEPPLLLLAGRYDTHPRYGRLILSLALAAMAATFLGCALAPSALTFGAAYSLFGTAVGVATGIAQAAVVERAENAERAMARWTLASTFGDLAAPLFLYLFQRTLGWRAALLGASVLIGASAMMSVGASSPPNEPASKTDPDPEDEESLGLRAALTTGLRNKPLVAWVIGAALSSLMDETLVVFGALHIRNRGGAWLSPEGAITMVLVAFALGATLGLIALDRALIRFPPITLLVAICIATALAFMAWLEAPTVTLSAGALFVVGFFVSAIYPLVKAQAYRAAPGQGALVNAVTQLFGPLDLIIPLGLGALADAYGVKAALLVMLLQPAAIVLIATASSATSRSGSAPTRASQPPPSA